MKNSTMTWMLAAAALTVAAGSALAQSQTYNVEIPVAFHVRQQAMAPGTYHISVNKMMANEVFTVYNVDTRSSAVIVSVARADAPKAWREAGKPVVSLECSNGVCALRRLWTGHDSFDYNFPGLKSVSGETRASVMTLTMTKAD